MKKVVILGSTGSIGTQALEVIQAFPHEFQVLAISADKNIDLLKKQVDLFHPRYVGVRNATLAIQLDKHVETLAGEEASELLASLYEADIIVNGISGIAGLNPLIAALKMGKTVALANKESIVCGNGIVKQVQDKYGGIILPVDSEHSAIFQCLQSGSKNEVHTLHLTASGGPLWKLDEQALKHITPKQALKHPVWNMGKKVSIDSATLFNKGLEIIEASYLFDIPYNQINVLIHPQSIVHSMVEYIDGAVIAQLSSPDMRLAIQYALFYPKRSERQIPRLDLCARNKLEFYKATHYPAIRLAYDALKEGRSMPVVYNAANEIAVELFLSGHISFLDIRNMVEQAMMSIPIVNVDTVESIFEIDRSARRFALAQASVVIER